MVVLVKQRWGLGRGGRWTARGEVLSPSLLYGSAQEGTPTSTGSTTFEEASLRVLIGIILLVFVIFLVSYIRRRLRRREERRASQARGTTPVGSGPRRPDLVFVGSRISEQGGRTSDSRNWVQRASSRRIGEILSECKVDEETYRYRNGDAKEDEEECPICFDTLDPSRGDVVSIPNCEHAFHASCMGQFLARSKNQLCPVCRGDGLCRLQKEIQDAHNPNPVMMVYAV